MKLAKVFTSLLIGAVAASGTAGASPRLAIWDCSADLVDIGINYFERVDTILLEAHPASSEFLIRALVLPAFEPEWAVTINGNGVEYRVAERQLWGANLVPVNDPDGRQSTQWSETAVTVPLSIRRRSVSPATVDAVATAWRVVFDQQRSSPQYGADGTLYHFFLNSPEQCSETWSPSPDTTAGRMVALAEALRRIVVDVGDEQEAHLEHLARVAAREVISSVAAPRTKVR